MPLETIPHPLVFLFVKVLRLNFGLQIVYGIAYEPGQQTCSASCHHHFEFLCPGTLPVVRHVFFHQLKAGKNDAHCNHFPYQSHIETQVNSLDSVSSVNISGRLQFSFINLFSTMILLLHQNPHVVRRCLLYTILTTDKALGIPVRILAMRRVSSVSP